MKTITQMRKDVEDLLQLLGDIDARCVAENREYNDEEKKLIKQTQVRIADLKENISLMEETQKLTKEANASVNPPTKPAPAAQTREHATVTPGDDKESFRSFGDFLMAVIRAGAPSPAFDPRLKAEERAYGLGESIGSEGGFLLQDNYASELIDTVWEEPEVLGKMNLLSITQGNNMKIPAVDETSRADGYRQGGIQMYWEAEAEEKTKSKPKFRKIELELKKLIGLCYATDELLNDAPALGSYIKDAFVREMRFKLINAGVNGTGAGQPLGVMNSGCLVTVAKETGQDADTVVSDNIIKMYSRMIASSRKNAVWHINQDVEPQLFTMGITVGLGGAPIFMPPGGLNQSPYSTLLGRPIIPLEQCDTLGDKGDILFADWTRYRAIDKGGLQQAVSIHVRFIYDESCFRFVYRFDGQPELASAITPFSGSGNTLSPFVTLAERA